MTAYHDHLTGRGVNLQPFWPSMFRSCCLLFLLPSLIWAKVDYLSEVKPMLQSACVKCHGQTTQKGGLRVDTGKALLKGGERGPLIVSGNASASALLAVLSGSHDQIPAMPYKRPALANEQIETLRQWIEEGAVIPNTETTSDDRHWAFVAPVSKPLPDGEGQPIDRLLAIHQDKVAIPRAALAQPTTLIRRLYLDLLGLPPPPEIVTEFVTQWQQRDSSSPEAIVQQWADRIMASLHYGERWARWWLDQARYADSNGYSIDAPGATG
jgi:mono/diheme cytochrome c family protein